MSILIDWLISGWISVAAVVVLWVETIILSMVTRSPALRLGKLLPNAISGTCLLAAVAVALSGANLVLILILMGGSLVAHAADILFRMRSGHSG